MDSPEKSNWWTENEGTRRVVAIASVLALILAVALLWSDIRDFLWVHPWWQSFIAALPGIALVVLAYFELRHSAEANTLRTRANDLREEANDYREEANALQRRVAELEAERNEHLQEIARNTKRPVTQAERNSETLRQHVRSQVAVVNRDDSIWGGTTEIAEVSDEIVTLFTPRSHTSSSAWCVQVHCSELEITRIPYGSGPLRLKILRRYGSDVQLGEITRWEDRNQPAATPSFNKGGMAYQAYYNKQGSSDRRTLHVFCSKDGANSFLLEASTGETIVADNKEISKRFMLLQIEYEAEGFTRQSSGTGGSPYPLFIKT